MNNLLLVPALMDPDSDGMSVKWDFTKRRHLLDQFGSISQKEILTWTEDVQCAGKDLEKQDMVWIMELARNSCTVDLHPRVERRWHSCQVIIKMTLLICGSCEADVQRER